MLCGHPELKQGSDQQPPKNNQNVLLKSAQKKLNMSSSEEIFEPPKTKHKRRFHYKRRCRNDPCLDLSSSNEEQDWIHAANDEMDNSREQSGAGTLPIFEADEGSDISMEDVPIQLDQNPHFGFG